MMKLKDFLNFINKDDFLDCNCYISSGENEVLDIEEVKFAKNSDGKIIIIFQSFTKDNIEKQNNNIKWYDGNTLEEIE